MSRRERSASRTLRRVGWAGIVCAALGVWVVESLNREYRRALATELRKRQLLKLTTAQDRVETYMERVRRSLRLLSLDPNILSASPESHAYFRAVHEAGYAEHLASEIYVVQHDLDETPGPIKAVTSFWLTSRVHDNDALHTPEREAEEYRVQAQHIRRFASNPSVDFLVSEPIPLCVGIPGIVASVPFEVNGSYAGIVAGMVPTESLADLLTDSSQGGLLVLVNDNGGLFGSVGVPRDTLDWFRERLTREGVCGFFDRAGAAFRSGPYQALVTQLSVPDDQHWHLALLYDDDEVTAALGPVATLTQWGFALLTLFLGGALAALCWFASSRSRDPQSLPPASAPAARQARVRSRDRNATAAVRPALRQP